MCMWSTADTQVGKGQVSRSSHSALSAAAGARADAIETLRETTSESTHNVAAQPHRTARAAQSVLRQDYRNGSRTHTPFRGAKVERERVAVRSRGATAGFAWRKPASASQQLSAGALSGALEWHLDARAEADGGRTPVGQGARRVLRAPRGGAWAHERFLGGSVAAASQWKLALLRPSTSARRAAAAP